MNDATKAWTDFHLTAVKDRYPLWPVEVMLKIIFGDYLKKKISIRPGMKVLDVGCGFGNNLLPFILKGAKGYGVEISDEIAELAKKIISERGFPDIDVRKGSNSSLPFENEFFDLIISNNVIHYQGTEENILQGFEEYSRALKPDGSLFLMTVGPEHEIYTRATTLGNHRYEIQNYDFRNGEKFFFFDSEKYLEFYLKKFFPLVETGRSTENLMKFKLDFLLAACHKS